MKLYTYPSAPSPKRVHLVLREKGVEIEQHHIDMMQGEHFSDEYRSINPRMTVPALQLDSGVLLTEVVAICAYLDEVYPQKPLYGDTAEQRAMVKQWDNRVAFEGLTAFAEVLRNRSEAFKGRALPGALNVEQIPELVQRGWQRLEAFYSVLNDQLSDFDHVAGDDFSIADISAYVLVSTGRWIKFAIKPEWPHLEEWFTRMDARFTDEA